MFYVNREVKIITPILIGKISFSNYEDRIHELTAKALNEIKQMSDLITLKIQDYFNEPKITITEIPISVINDKYSYNEDRYECRVIEFKVLVTCNITEFHSYLKEINNDVEFTEESVLDFVNFAITDKLENKIFELLLISNIAKPGCLSFDKTMINIDSNSIKNNEGYFTHIDEFIGIFEKYGDLFIKELSLKSVWDWYFSLNDFDDGLAVDCIGRAIAAFSYYFKQQPHESPIDTIWALVGLESLFVHSNNKVRKQFISNCNQLMGKKIINQFFLKKLYKFRSDFLHGDMKFPLSNHYMNYDYESFSEKENKAFIFAIVLLIGCLQQLVVLGITDIKSYFTNTP